MICERCTPCDARGVVGQCRFPSLEPSSKPAASSAPGWAILGWLRPFVFFVTADSSSPSSGPPHLGCGPPLLSHRKMDKVRNNGHSPDEKTYCDLYLGGQGRKASNPRARVRAPAIISESKLLLHDLKMRSTTQPDTALYPVPMPKHPSDNAGLAC